MASLVRNKLANFTIEHSKGTTILKQLAKLDNTVLVRLVSGLSSNNIEVKLRNITGALFDEQFQAIKAQEQEVAECKEALMAVVMHTFNSEYMESSGTYNFRAFDEASSQLVHAKVGGSSSASGLEEN